MLIKILLVIAIVIQCVATGYALRLVRTTKYNSVWILFIVGFSLLSVERLIQLLLVSGFEVIPRWWFGYLGIVISVCLSIGVMYAHKLFKYINRLNRQRSLLNKRILTAVLRTEEKARSRFSKELHDGLGPLLSSAKMSLTALARVRPMCTTPLREISNNLSRDGACRTHRQERCDARRRRRNLRSERYDPTSRWILHRVICELANCFSTPPARRSLSQNEELIQLTTGGGSLNNLRPTCSTISGWHGACRTSSTRALRCTT